MREVFGKGAGKDVGRLLTAVVAAGLCLVAWTGFAKREERSQPESSETRATELQQAQQDKAAAERTSAATIKMGIRLTKELWRLRRENDALKTTNARLSRENLTAEK